MRVGVAFPQTDIGTDPIVIRDFAQAVEGLGYDHLTCIDHVLQARNKSPGWREFYSRDNMFHEILVLFGFLAAVTERIELATAILILPQRQAVLVAKQAAEIDVLSRGRLRLGVGLGWNEVEFTALGEDFHTRGRRIEEQVAVMRRLWTEEVITHDGAQHRIDDAGLNPLPVQRPIPVWFGAFEPPAIRRAARVSDGWFFNPRVGLGDEADRQLAMFREEAARVGRDPAALGIDVTVHVGGKGPEQWAQEAAAWRSRGISHVTVRTMYAGLEGIDQHIDAIRRFREVWPA